MRSAFGALVIDCSALVCETTYQEYQVDEDNPVCDTVQEEVCDGNDCKNIPKQVCTLAVKTSNKVKPDSKVTKFVIKSKTLCIIENCFVFSAEELQCPFAALSRVL